MKIKCVVCESREMDRDTISINKKLLGKSLSNYYCMNCLAAYLDCELEDLLDKIQEFKDEGCSLFEN